MSEQREELIPIYVAGVRQMVPPLFTIMRAMEYAGYTLIHNCGCRGGVCGACTTEYRLPGDPTIKRGLACQTMVEPGMQLVQIPFYPARRATFDLEKVEPSAAGLVELYPELAKCLGCNSCTKVCPQELDVMGYISAALRGDLKEVRRLSFECIMCGTCATHCPQEIPQYQIAMLARRLEGRYLMPPAPMLEKRVEEINSGFYDAELANLKKLGKEELEERWKANQIDVKRW